MNEACKGVRTPFLNGRLDTILGTSRANLEDIECENIVSARQSATTRRANAPVKRMVLHPDRSCKLYDVKIIIQS